MASFGDAACSSTTAGESDHSYICSPCDVDGQKLKAVGYCVDCRENLCRRCFDVHLIPKPSQKHTLLGEARMDVINATHTSICLEHEDRQIEYYCPTHSFFGCHLCFFKHQRNCKDVQFIPDVSETITDSEEYKLFINRLPNIVSTCKKLVTEVKEQIETKATQVTEAVTAIKEFKREIVDAVEKRETELLEKAGTVKQEEKTKMTEVVDKCTDILQEAQTITCTLERLRNKHQNREVYMTMIQSKDNVLSLENDVQAAATNINSRRFAFSTNNGLLEMLKSPFGLGTLHQTDNITKVEHVQDINIKSEEDAFVCVSFPCGSVLLPGQKLAIADYDHSKVKLLDTNHNKLVSELKMASSPYGICQVTEDQVAATLHWVKKVALVRTSPSLRLDRTIKVNGHCRGVGYCDGKLVVSIDPKKVEVLDMQGNVLKKIETDGKGTSLTVNPKSELIYVSNYNSDNIMCMKFDGTVVARYKDHKLKGPWQIVFTGRGTAFVCGRDSHNIHQITEDCKKGKVLLTSTDGLVNPESVSYCEQTEKLFIGLRRNDNLKVFKVHFAAL